MSAGLANIALDVGRSTAKERQKPADIITFIESSWGLNFKLFPVQRVILKAHYGMALDDNPHKVPLDRPIPKSHPHYDELIDKPPVPAKNGIEVQAGGLIPDDATICLTEPDGSQVVLQNGIDWSSNGSRREILVSISDALNQAGYPTEIRLGERTVLIFSQVEGPDANEGAITLTESHGWRISMPSLEIDQHGYDPHDFNFYGGGGGFYKYRIVISDWRRENYQYMTEAGYLRYLHDDGRCNISKVDEGHERREMVLSIGRRSGKTTISACIAAYETYKLLLLGDPQDYYGLPPSNVIQIISVATDKDQAGLLYREVSGHYKSSDYFTPYSANHTLTYANFQTPADIDRYGSYRDNPKVPSSIKVTFRSCVAKGLRGAGNLIVILDEFAHFTDGTHSSAKAVYDAVTPSTSAFSPKDPNDSRIPIGEVEGRIILISSPLGKQGQFYKLFRIGFDSGKAARNMLCIQAPTWEVNPTLPAHEFEKHYVKDARVFFTEYGGEFTDKTLGWIEDDKDLFACIDPRARPRMRRRRPVPHYAGFDLGLVKDGSAIAIGHLEDNRVIVDVVDQIVAGEGDFEGCERLKVEWVAEWVQGWAKRFPISSGLFDQWSGLAFEDALAQLGLKQFKSEQFTKTLNSQVYDRFKDLMLNERLVLYDYPIPPNPEEGEHCAYIQELTELQAQIQSKHIILVQAPQVEGKHDDMSDALVRMVWEASQHLVKSGHLATGRGRRGKRKIPNQPEKPSNAKWRKVRRQAQLGGSHPSRQVPKRGRNGRLSASSRVLLSKNKKR